MGDVITNMKVRFGADTKQFQKGLTDGRKGIDRFSKSSAQSTSKASRAWKKLGTSIKSFLPIAGFAAIIAGLRKMLQITTEFEKAQSGLAAALGTTREQITELTKDAIRYGSVTAFTAKEVSELQTQFARFGFSITQIKASTEAALNLAAATGGDLAGAAEVTAIALKGFNLSAANAERVASTMAVATSKSALSFEDFKTALATVAPVARAFGFSFEDTIALLGKLKDAGFDASTASTALKNILLNLADTNGKLSKKLGEPIKTLDDLVPALAKLKAEGVDLNETLQLTDKRSVAAFNTFIEAGDSALVLRDGISGVNDELKEMVDTQLDNVAGDITILTSAWQGFVLSIENGDGVISKFVRGTLKLLTDSLIKLANIDIIFKRASKFTADDTASAYDAMLNLSGKKYKAFQNLVAKEEKLTLAQIILRRRAMIEEIETTGQSTTEATLLWNEFYKRRKEQDALDKKLKAEEIALEKYKQSELEKTTEKLKKQAAAKQAAAVAEKKAEEEAIIRAANAKIKSVTSLGAGSLFDPAEIKKAAEETQKAFEESFQFNENIELLETAKLLANLKTNLGEAQTIVLDFADVFNATFENLAVSFGENMGRLLSGASGFQDFGKVVLSSLGGLAVQVGKMAIATGVALIGIKKALQSMNPYVAIAGGVALVALGTAVTSALSSAGDSMGGGTFSGNSGTYRSVSVGDSAGAGVAGAQAQSLNITITGETVTRGTDIVTSYNETVKRNTYAG